MGTKLPLEICFDIMEDVYFCAGGSVDRNSIAACAQVCSSWKEPSQRLLFYTINLAPDESWKYQALVDLLSPSSDRGEILGSYVRCLSVHIGPTSSPQSGLRQDELPRLLSSVPLLSSLAMSSSILKFNAKNMGELQGVLPKLQSFTLTNCSLQSPILYQIVSLWPTIQCLDISCWTFTSPPSERLSLELDTLTISSCEQASMHVLDWLLRSSNKTLRVFELRDEPGGRMTSFLAEHGHGIRSLRLPCFNKASAHIVDLCPMLEELELEIYYKAALTRMHGLPGSITHFTFRNLTNGSLNSSVVNTIRMLPRLRVLSGDKQSDQQTDFSVLLAECNARGIDLRINAESSLWTVSGLFGHFMNRL